MPQCFDRTSELQQSSLCHIVVLENIAGFARCCCNSIWWVSLRVTDGVRVWFVNILFEYFSRLFVVNWFLEFLFMWSWTIKAMLIDLLKFWRILWGTLWGSFIIDPMIFLPCWLILNLGIHSTHFLVSCTAQFQDLQCLIWCVCRFEVYGIRWVEWVVFWCVFVVELHSNLFNQIMFYWDNFDDLMKFWRIYLHTTCGSWFQPMIVLIFCFGSFA